MERGKIPRESRSRKKRPPPPPPLFYVSISFDLFNDSKTRARIGVDRRPSKVRVLAEPGWAVGRKHRVIDFCRGFGRRYPFYRVYAISAIVRTRRRWRASRRPSPIGGYRPQGAALIIGPCSAHRESLRYSVRKRSSVHRCFRARTRSSSARARTCEKQDVNLRTRSAPANGHGALSSSFSFSSTSRDREKARSRTERPPRWFLYRN